MTKKTGPLHHNAATPQAPQPIENTLISSVSSINTADSSNDNNDNDDKNNAMNKLLRLESALVILQSRKNNNKYIYLDDVINVVLNLYPSNDEKKKALLTLVNTGGDELYKLSFRRAAGAVGGVKEGVYMEIPKQEKRMESLKRKWHDCNRALLLPQSSQTMKHDKNKNLIDCHFQMMERGDTTTQKKNINQNSSSSSINGNKKKSSLHNLLGDTNDTTNLPSTSDANDDGTSPPTTTLSQRVHARAAAKTLQNSLHPPPPAPPEFSPTELLCLADAIHAHVSQTRSRTSAFQGGGTPSSLPVVLSIKDVAQRFKGALVRGTVSSRGAVLRAIIVLAEMVPEWISIGKQLSCDNGKLVNGDDTGGVGNNVTSKKLTKDCVVAVQLSNKFHSHVRVKLGGRKRTCETLTKRRQRDGGVGKNVHVAVMPQKNTKKRPRDEGDKNEVTMVHALSKKTSITKSPVRPDESRALSTTVPPQQEQAQPASVTTTKISLSPSSSKRASKLSLSKRKRERQQQSSENVTSTSVTTDTATTTNASHTGKRRRVATPIPIPSFRPPLPEDHNNDNVASAVTVEQKHRHATLQKKKKKKKRQELRVNPHLSWGGSGGYGSDGDMVLPASLLSPSSREDLSGGTLATPRGLKRLFSQMNQGQRI